MNDLEKCFKLVDVMEKFLDNMNTSIEILKKNQEVRKNVVKGLKKVTRS